MVDKFGNGMALLTQTLLLNGRVIDGLSSKCYEVRDRTALHSCEWWERLLMNLPSQIWA